MLKWMIMGFLQRPRRFASEGHQMDAFPRAQLSVLAICRLCEPIAFMSVFPYIYYMVQSFGDTHDSKQITLYAGLVTSAFAFAEALSSMIWGSLSDRIGRKPVLLTGLAGTGLSMLMFGFSTSLPLAILARFLGGLLNGNIGVIQTTVAEVVRVESHQPRAYSILPFVWSFGAIVGSAIGGGLAEPVKHYPQWIRPGSIFERFPFLLPNLICALISLGSFTVGFLFLEETHEDKVHRRDYGLEIGQRVLNWIRPSVQLAEIQYDCDALDEKLASYVDEKLPVYQISRPSTPSDCSADVETGQGDAEKVGFRQAFSKPVLVAFLGYGILAFHTICIETLLPILYEMPHSDSAPLLPFKFSGGFGLSAKTVGGIISGQAFIQMVVQVFIYPNVCRRLGSVNLFRLTCFSYPIFYFLVPYIVVLPRNFGYVGIFAVMVTKVTLAAFLVPSIQIIIARVAPSKKVLGTINGYGASIATVFRGIGSIVAGLIQDQGLKMGFTGLAWWFLACVAVLGYFESLWLSDGSAASAPAALTTADELLLADHFVDAPNLPITSEHANRSSCPTLGARTSIDSIGDARRTF